MKHIKGQRYSTRFRWSRYYPGDKKAAAIRLYCSGDGTKAKVTQCRDLTPEEMADAGKWLIEVAQAMKQIRIDVASGSAPKMRARKKRAA